MARVLCVLLFVIIGFAVAAPAGYFLISKLSSNRHDSAVEAIMTGIFVFGPIGAISAGVGAFIRTAHWGES